MSEPVFWLCLGIVLGAWAVGLLLALVSVVRGFLPASRRSAAGAHIPNPRDSSRMHYRPVRNRASRLRIWALLAVPLALATMFLLGVIDGPWTFGLGGLGSSLFAE